MVKYIFNPEYVINENEKMNVVFTSEMENIYVLKDVESIILKSFHQEKTIDEAVREIKTLFTYDTFNQEECIEFINTLIKEGVLVNAQD